MKKRGTTPATPRRRAPGIARTKTAELRHLSAMDVRRLAENLQMHEIDLQVQNDTLRSMQSELQDARDRYLELYEFAPVGYFTLDVRGVVRGANLTGAGILGAERRALVGRGLSRFVAPESQLAFYQHCRRMSDSHIEGECDLDMVRADGTRFQAHLQSMPASSGAAAHEFRVALSDVTERKTAEQRLRAAHADLERRVAERTAELEQINRVLRDEVDERKRAQEAHAQVLRRVVDAQEVERCRVARELHDELGQALVALGLRIKSLESVPRGADPRDVVADLGQMVNAMLRHMHRLAWELRPPALDDLGLEEALERYGQDWSRQTGVDVDFHSHGFARGRLAPPLETTLFRITQEALTNVHKHSRASHVSILLERRRECGLLIVEDNGAGFDALAVFDSPEKQASLGFLGMRERATLVGGTISVESTIGSGTTVFVRVPMPLGEDEKVVSQP
jgi:PAS domain S-box-containing protein